MDNTPLAPLLNSKFLQKYGDYTLHNLLFYLAEVKLIDETLSPRDKVYAATLYKDSRLKAIKFVRDSMTMVAVRAAEMYLNGLTDDFGFPFSNITKDGALKEASLLDTLMSCPATHQESSAWIYMDTLTLQQICTILELIPPNKGDEFATLPFVEVVSRWIHNKEGLYDLFMTAKFSDNAFIKVLNDELGKISRFQYELIKRYLYGKFASLERPEDNEYTSTVVS